MAPEMLSEATHTDDFAEHLNMHKTRTFHGNKGKNSFVHWYETKGKAHEDSSHTFHGIMQYHGYKEDRSPEAQQIHYKGEDEHRDHHVVAALNKDGHVVHIRHHERFKNVNEDQINEIKTFTKTLRKIVPQKKGTDFDSALDSHPAPSQKAAERKFTKSLSDIISIKGQNGEPDSYATTKPSKKPGPNAGKTAPMASLKEDEQLDELSRKTLRSYRRKANNSAFTHYAKGGKEEDKAMSTDGNKYPEKQARHQKAAAVHQKIEARRNRGLAMAKAKLGEDVQIDELSVKKLAQYHNATDGSRGEARSINHVPKQDKRPFIKALQARTHKRSVGRGRAINKILGAKMGGNARVPASQE